MSNPNISIAELQGILHLAKTDPGMQDLLCRVKEYYVLKGAPGGPRVFSEREETAAEAEHRIMNTRYGF
jgi:hypothetical protein